ncbi:MAG: hypothetical protein L3J49_04135 [Desulfobulbaceae bacterium]|nr:hypothetical protein [Desulfobulbaceae bacterium]
MTACLKKHSPKTKNSLHRKYCFLSVQAAYNPDYFLFLLVVQDATVEDLDDYLRKIWLECCGHMSSFSYGKWGEELPLTTKIREICLRGESLTYMYDFGSTTELQVKIFREVASSIKISEDIILLTRNAEPLIPCDVCSKYPAKHICTECQWNGDNGWLCEKCAKTHECGDERFLPVVNSPRTGVCAYTGEEEKERPIPESLKKILAAKKMGLKLPNSSSTSGRLITDR